MLYITGGKSCKHQCIVELALGKRRLYTEADTVTQFKTGRWIGIGREPFIALKYFGSAGTKSFQPFFTQRRKCKISLISIL